MFLLLFSSYFSTDFSTNFSTRLSSFFFEFRVIEMHTLDWIACEYGLVMLWRYSLSVEK